jgi:class 3 adenylate cyclase
MADVLVLLFTDVVDSTQLNETLGDEVMGPIWQAHDFVALQLIGFWHGRR